MRYPINFQRTPVTMILLGVMASLTIFFGLKQGTRVEFYNEYLGLLVYVWQGELWRPFTSCLMHANLLHAAFNLWLFVVFSSALEPHFGSKRYLGLLVLLAYVSILPEFVVHGYISKTPIMIVGFSGVVYGLFGFLTVGRRYRGEFFEVCDYRVSQLLIAWFFISIVITWAGIMPVANIAHGAGWFFGWLYGMAVFQQRDRKMWIAAAVILTLVVLATLVICPGNYGFEDIRDHRQLWWQF